MRSSKFATAFNLASAILSLGAQLAVSFFLSSYLVATLGEVTNGLTQLANNFVSYASLVTIAFNSMGSRFISTCYHKGDLDGAQGYYSTLVVCNIALCLVFLPLAAWLVGNLPNIVSLGDANVGDAQLLFAFVLANFGANLFVSLLCAAMFVTNTVYIQNAVNLARNLLNAVLLLFVFSFNEPHVQYVSLVSLVLTVASMPVCYIAKSRLLPDVRFSLRGFSWRSVRGLVSSGVWNTVNQCGNMLNTGLDLLLANWFVGASPMGVLSVAKTVPNAIINLAMTINTNLEPELVIAYARGGAAGIAGRLRLDVKLSNLIVSVPIGVFCALSIPFYELWMPSLDAVELAILAALTLLPFIPWAGLQTLYNVFTATNHLKVNSVAFLAGSALNLIAVIALLEGTELGVYAVAGTSSVISVLRNLLVIVPYVAHLLGCRKRSLYAQAGVSLASFAASIAISLAVGATVGTGSWPLLAASVFLACCLSWLCVFLATFSREERRRVFDMFSGFFARLRK